MVTPQEHVKLAAKYLHMKAKHKRSVEEHTVYTQTIQLHLELAKVMWTVGVEDDEVDLKAWGEL